MTIPTDNSSRPMTWPEGSNSHCLDCHNGLQGGCGDCSTCGRAYDAPRGKLSAVNWLGGISDASDYDLIEVQFKNTRRGFFLNPMGLDLHIGDQVVVEASPGYDIGRISMVGRLVQLHMRKANLKSDTEFRRIIRIPTEADLEKFDEAKAREQDTMMRSRKIAEELALNMKIGDVEYQGDGTKAIFYYIADERVDFRRLIRVLADTFRIRIEMKQIGARQEAGRIGGIGPCGRPLCCSSWMTGFVSVGTTAARAQDISMNPQKLAGQCAKLKCCLNFEVDTYIEAARNLPKRDAVLETTEQTYYHFKTDILAGSLTYSTNPKAPENLVTITATRAREILAMNRAGTKPETLAPDTQNPPKKTEFVELVGQDNINRFDKSRKKRPPKRDNTQDRGPRPPRNNQRPNRRPGNNQPSQENNPKPAPKNAKKPQDT